MSVINQVLKDLDRQGANASTPSGVIAVNQQDVAAPRWPWLLIGAAGLAAAAWWFWPGASVPRVAVPATPVENSPQLQLTRQLSPLPESAPAAANQSRPALASRPAPPTAVAVIPTAKPQLDTRLPEPRPSEIAKPTVAKEIKPPTPQVQAEDAFRQAGRLLEQGHNSEAQERLEYALRLDTNHAGARQSLVALVLEGGDSARAEALLREGLTLHPNETWYPRSLAQLHLQRGDTAQAVAILKAGLNKRADAANWGLYASTLAKLGKPEDAAQAYREALRLNSGQGNWWIGLAVALEQTGGNAEAGAAYQRALQTRLSAELREFAQQKVRELGAR